MIYDSIVVGAGVTGVTTAYYLAKSGHKVLVIDENANAADEKNSASYANGGQISVSHAEPWASPGTIPKMLSWLGKEDAPLLWHWNTDIRQWMWGIAFMNECRPKNWRRNIKNIVNMATYSRAKLQELRNAEQIEYDHLEKGIIHFYTDKKEWAAAQAASEILDQYGCHRIPLTPNKLVAIEPALGFAAQDIVGGTYTKADESGDARAFTRKLAWICRDKYGVVFKFGTRVSDIHNAATGHPVLKVDDGGIQYLCSADNIVICAGAYSPLLTRAFGENLNIFPAKGYSATVDVLDAKRIPKVSLTDDGYKIVISRFGDTLRIAGTAEFTGYNHGLNRDRCEALTNRAKHLFGADSAEWDKARFWSGLRPTTPSNVPYIGPSRKLRNVFFNTGHGTLGWTMACGSAASIAAIVNNEALGDGSSMDFDFYK